MIAIAGVVVALLLVGLFFLLRSMGSMGQQPSAYERMKHNGTEPSSGSGPRATGLN